MVLCCVVMAGRALNFRNVLHIAHIKTKTTCILSYRWWGTGKKRTKDSHAHTFQIFGANARLTHTSFAACCQLNLIHFGLEITTVPRKMNQSIVLPSHLYTQRRRSLVNSLHNARIKCQPKSMPACLAY